MSLAFLSEYCADKVKAGDRTSYVEKKCTDKEKAGSPDNCSPFCTCSCCGTIVDVNPTSVNNFVPVTYVVNYSAVAVSPLSAMPTDFWQPPQLG